MFGGIAMLGLMILVSLLDRRAWWSYPTLLGANFYGPRVIAAGPGWPAVSGIALHLLIASIAGAVFGAVLGGYSHARRIALLGLIWGIALFYVTDWLYRKVSPVASAYLPRAASLAGYMIYGVCLAGIGKVGAAPPRLTPASDSDVRTPLLPASHTSPLLPEDSAPAGPDDASPVPASAPDDAGAEPSLHSDER